MKANVTWKIRFYKWITENETAGTMGLRKWGESSGEKKHFSHQYLRTVRNNCAAYVGETKNCGSTADLTSKLMFTQVRDIAILALLAF
jgi:hypothetical protein